MDRLTVEEGLREHQSLVDTVTEKYTLPDENTLSDVFARNAKVYYENSPFSQEVDDSVARFDGFRGAGSILAGAGNYEFKSSLSNCYYTPIEEDSIEGIFEAIKKMARTYSYRGGTGTSISILRPKKDPVQNSARMSSGAVSFMPMLSETTETIGQEGRRGALIIILDVRHPDILDFIWSKSKPEAVFGRDALTGKVPTISGANISVAVTDDFMAAVEADSDWTFRFPDRSDDPVKYDQEWDGDFDKWDGEWREYFTMPAREVLEQVAEAAHMSAEPGVLFMDTAKKYAPGTYIDESLKPTGSNPCFPRGTLLLDGDRLRPIEDQEAETWDSWYSGEKEVWEFYTSIGSSFRCTEDHNLMLSNGSFKKAIECVGRKLENPIKMFPTLDSIEEYLNNFPHLKTEDSLYITDYKYIGVTEVWDYRMKYPPHYNFCGGVVAKNCGEQMLPDYNNCLLAPLVLTEFIHNPFEEDAQIDRSRFEQAVRNSVRFLNVMSDINEGCHPLPEQREADAYGKRIGVEFTGLADALAMLGLEYGSSKSIETVKSLTRDKACIEIDESCRIAEEIGCCSAMTSMDARENFLENPYIQNLELDDDLKHRIKEYGLRNTAFNTVGPTGSLSMIVGNVTSGLEPLFNVSSKRKTRLTEKTFDIIHKPILDYLNQLSDEELEKYNVEDLADNFNYVEAHKLDWKDRIEMQAAVQEFTDASVSSTLNLPQDCTVEDVLDIYKTAYEKGLKGVTVYREGSRSGVLSASDQNGEHDKPIVNENFYVRDLLDVERAERHRIKWNGAKMYCIVSLDDDDQPVEVFAKLPREAGYDGNGMYRESVYQEKYSLWESICRLVSLHLRSAMPLGMVLKQLDKSSYSMTDASSVLARVLRTYIPEDEGQKCPSCGYFTYMHHGNCPTCTTCGHSSCG